MRAARANMCKYRLSALASGVTHNTSVIFERTGGKEDRREGFFQL